MQHQKDMGYLLQHLAFTLARQNDQVLQERLGIGFSQFKILMVLSEYPYVQQRDIAETLGQTEASISRQIKLMHEMGLLQTQIRPENRRRHLTILTTKGIRFTDEAVKILNAFQSPILERLSPKQQEVLSEALTIMHACVCEPGKMYACQQPFHA